MTDALMVFPPSGQPPLSPFSRSADSLWVDPEFPSKIYRREAGFRTIQVTKLCRPLFFFAATAWLPFLFLHPEAQYPGPAVSLPFFFFVTVDVNSETLFPLLFYVVICRQ